MGIYLKGAAAVLTGLFPRHNFERDARFLDPPTNEQVLIEVTDQEYADAGMPDEGVTILTHAEALAEVDVLREDLPPDEEPQP